jgi:hypothetical protein
VDEFDKQQGAGEAGECLKGGCGLVTAERDALEALEFPHCLLDPSSELVKRFGKEAAALG